MHLAEDLLRSAEELAERSGAEAQSGQAVVRRAISTAYYALFHGV